jgi:hypothetical protein
MHICLIANITMNYSNELWCFPSKEKKTILVSLAPITNKLINIHVKTPISLENENFKPIWTHVGLFVKLHKHGLPMLHLHDSRIVIANMALEEKSSNGRGRWNQFFNSMCYAHHKILGSMWWSCVKVMWEDCFLFLFEFSFFDWDVRGHNCKEKLCKKTWRVCKRNKVAWGVKKKSCVNKCLGKKLDYTCNLTKTVIEIHVFKRGVASIRSMVLTTQIM